MIIDYHVFEENLRKVRGRIEQSAMAAGRSSNAVQLLPVTKNHPLDAVRFAYRSGLKSVGENRVQEALSKMNDADEEIFWELIGPLQSNKVKKAAERFYRIQSVDRIKIVNLLQRHAAEAERNLRILLQINTGNDPNKSGARLEDASALLERALSQPNLKVDGLMTIAPLSSDLNIARKSFASLRKCREELAESFKVDLPELSMGMSGDMQEAILEGSTIVRVGTALFGKRDYA